MKRLVRFGLFISFLSSSSHAFAYPMFNVEVMGGAQSTKTQDADTFTGTQYGAAVNFLPFQFPLTVGGYFSQMNLKATNDADESTTNLTGTMAGIQATSTLHMHYIHPYIKVGYDLYGKCNANTDYAYDGGVFTVMSKGNISGYRGSLGILVRVFRAVGVFVEGNIAEETFKVQSTDSSDSGTAVALSDSIDREDSSVKLSSRTYLIGLRVML